MRQIKKKMPSKCYVYTLRYQYAAVEHINNGKSKVLLKHVLSENDKLKPEERLQVKGAEFIRVENRQEIDVAKYLKMAQKRITLHVIQWKTGRKKRHYLLKNGVLQGE